MSDHEFIIEISKEFAMAGDIRVRHNQVWVIGSGDHDQLPDLEKSIEHRLGLVLVRQTHASVAYEHVGDALAIFDTGQDPATRIGRGLTRRDDRHAVQEVRALTMLRDHIHAEHIPYDVLEPRIDIDDAVEWLGTIPVRTIPRLDAHLSPPNLTIAPEPPEAMAG